MATCPEFSRVLEDVVDASPGHCVVVDLTRTSFVAACAVAALTRGRATAATGGASIQVVMSAANPASNLVSRILDAGAGFPVHPDLGAAEAAAETVLRPRSDTALRHQAPGRRS